MYNSIINNTFFTLIKRKGAFCMNVESIDYKPKYPVQALSNAIEIIEYLKKNNSYEGVSISELSKHLALPKSNIHRLLDTLLAYDYVEKTNNGFSYRLGWGLYDAGNIVPEQHTLNSANYIPALEKLCKKFDETVNLGILSRTEVIIICKIEPNVRIRANVQIGEREPLYATSLGKIFMSEYTNDKVINYFSKNKVVKFTDNTIGTAEDMLNELSQVRKQGYAVDNEEFSFGLVCVAMPIRDYSGKIVSAVSLSGPATRMTEEKRRQILLDLNKSCAELSSFMGYKA